MCDYIVFVRIHYRERFVEENFCHLSEISSLFLDEKFYLQLLQYGAEMLYLTPHVNIWPPLNLKLLIAIPLKRESMVEKYGKFVTRKSTQAITNIQVF